MKYISSTSVFHVVTQLLSLHVVSDNITLRTSWLLQWKRTLIPEVLLKVMVHILSVSDGRAVGKSV